VHIESYSFGRVGINGGIYTDDVLIVGNEVHSPWWRTAGGHVFATCDLEPLISAAPEVVVLGTGFFGMVLVPEDAVLALTEAGAEVVIERTGKAVKEFNRRAEQGRD